MLGYFCDARPQDSREFCSVVLGREQKSPSKVTAWRIDMQEKMHFTRMDQGTDEDFQILKRVHENTLKELPDRLIAMLNDLSGDQAYNLNRKEHSLQTATRHARRSR